MICNYYSLNGRLNLKEYMNHPAVAGLKCEHLDMVVEHVKSVETSLPCSIASSSTSENMGFTQQFDIQIFAGNVSKFLNPENSKKSSRLLDTAYSQTATQYDQDLITHRWMVYIRSPNCPRLENYVRKVVFYLHSSYKPHDMIEVKYELCQSNFSSHISLYLINRSPPFQLIRRGWGEFPVHVQIHFKDARNKRVDINHQLKLDWTQTGLQTFGGETSCIVRLSLKPNDYVKDNHSVTKNVATASEKTCEEFHIDSPTVMGANEEPAPKRRLSSSSSGSSSHLTFKKVHSTLSLQQQHTSTHWDTLNNNMTSFEEMINSFTESKSYAERSEGTEENAASSGSYCF